MEWDGTRSDDGGGAGGVALGWVFTVEGSARVRVHWDGWGVMRCGRGHHTSHANGRWPSAGA